MKINNFKHSLWGLLFSFLILIPVCLGIVVLINAKELIGVILYSLFLILVIILSSISLVDMQWANIYNDKIVVRNIFGVVKEIEYKDINKSFKINATIFSIKMLGIRKPYIVLSMYKSLQESQIGDAYNRKKYKYVILPMSIRNEKIIKEKYKACTGNELNF